LEWLSIVSSERLTLTTMVASASGMYHMPVLNPEILPWYRSLLQRRPRLRPPA
jgi:hypothetical protein